VYPNVYFGITFNGIFKVYSIQKAFFKQHHSTGLKSLKKMVFLLIPTQILPLF
jgi:hypothetical protein